MNKADTAERSSISELCALLGRREIKLCEKKILKPLKGRTMLVTGGGGSIGSELCRFAAQAEPERLIIYDICENSAYELQQELSAKHPELCLTVLIGSVRDAGRISGVMKKYRPDIVFHAAAHKHVPLMEESPGEAVKNNVFGTCNTVRAAAEAGVSSFVLLSTDKAVNPTSVMGATKRICEMAVQAADRKYPGTRFCAVRFGNVIGSNGSVIPLFKRQIEAGGPVTVTDRETYRYFMTVTEAAALVLQALSCAAGGEIFVLDMGKPVKIDDVARALIRFYGFEPDRDIKIRYIGMRPGEKLYEELLMDEEGLQSTDNELIRIGRPIRMDDGEFEAKLAALAAASLGESADIRAALEDMVPTYHPAEE